MRKELSRFEVAEILERFLDGSSGPWDWDDFTRGMSFRDRALEAIRLRCSCLSEEFPPTAPNRYCGEKGLEVIRSYIAELRKPE
jgi:hypothetical protein